MIYSSEREKGKLSEPSEANQNGSGREIFCLSRWEDVESERQVLT
jgi:hypothetical protein